MQGFTDEQILAQIREGAKIEKKEKWEPNIIGFCCNWCSYAGADMAGVSRIQYAPNLRIVRVMCSGRVNPVFITKAFELGADGVLVSGCHIGDCHYISGNEKAEQRIRTLGKITEIIGIGQNRLKLEWVSASEGAKFGNVVNEFVANVRRLGPLELNQDNSEKRETSLNVDQIVEETKTFNCVDCGKCTGACPIAQRNPEFTPRMTVEKALAGLEDEIKSSKEMWMCIACNLCLSRCPSKVNYAEFIRELRIAGSSMGNKPSCSHSEFFQSIYRLMANIKKRSPNRRYWLAEDLKTAESGELFYFVGCIPIFNEFFRDILGKAIETPRSAVRLLNKCGISPVVSNEEVCCGHDLLWTGDVENFRKLARINVDAIRKSGAKTVITTCPECYMTLKVHYPTVVGELGFEVLHISEYLTKDAGKIVFEKSSEAVTYHDGCILGRFMNVHDQPRKLLNEVTTELKEMERVKDASPCCGVTSWSTCTPIARAMQVDRLREARGTGVKKLITSCPKCIVHFKCALHGQLPIDKSTVDIDIDDLTAFIDEHSQSAKASEDAEGRNIA